MSRLQRRLLAALAAFSVLVGAAFVVVADRRSDDGGAPRLAAAEDRTTSTTGKSETTFALVPVEGGAPLPSTTPATDPPAPTSSTAAPSPMATTAQSSLDGRGAILGPPTDTTPRTSNPSQGCKSLNAPTWSVKECGVASTPSGTVTWLIETRGSGWRASLLSQAGPSQWTPFLAANDDSAARWSEVKAKVVEGPSGSNDQMIGFGFKARNGALAFDLVRQAAVGLHLDLAQGSVRLSRAQVDAWAAQADGNFLHRTIGWVSGVWRVLRTETVPARLVPPSHV
ncbi:MAG: hypothetical protein ACR2H3_11425 [Acidimicrobiales bacterium]